MVDFGDYPTMLLRMLNQCIREPHIHLAVFVMQPSGEARLDFIQVSKCKCNGGLQGEGACHSSESGTWNSVMRRVTGVGCISSEQREGYDRRKLRQDIKHK
jgi:hypothetical protein